MKASGRPAKEGKGKMTYASGRIYDGEWKDNKREGSGMYTWAMY